MKKLLFSFILLLAPYGAYAHHAPPIQFKTHRAPVTCTSVENIVRYHEEEFKQTMKLTKLGARDVVHVMYSGGGFSTFHFLFYKNGRGCIIDFYPHSAPNPKGKSI